MTAEQLKASVLQAAFEGELTSAWREKNGLTMESWRHVKFADLGTAHLGKMLDKAKNVGTPVRYLRNVNVRWFDFDMSDILEMRVTEEEQIKLQAKPGDLFICEGGEPGRCAVWRDESQQIVFQKALHRFRPSKSSDSDFVSFYIYWLSLNGTLSSFFTGTTIKHLTGKALAEVPFFLPSLEEQRQIIVEIKKILPLIEEYGKAYSALKNAEEALPDQLRASLLQEAIQGKLVPQLDDEPAVDMDAAEVEDAPFAIPEKWQWVRLGDVGNIVSGATPKTSNAQFWEPGTIPWITPADLGKNNSKTISHGQRFISQKGLDSCSAVLMPKDSIVYSSRAPIGHIAIAENELCTNQGCKSVVPNTQIVLPEYVYYTLISLTPDIQRRASGTTFLEISGKKMGETLFPLPPLAEQRRIVARLEELLPHVDAIAGLR